MIILFGLMIIINLGCAIAIPFGFRPHAEGLEMAANIAGAVGFLALILVWK